MNIYIPLSLYFHLDLLLIMSFHTLIDPGQHCLLYLWIYMLKARDALSAVGGATLAGGYDHFLGIRTLVVTVPVQQVIVTEQLLPRGDVSIGNAGKHSTSRGEFNLITPIYI